MWYEGLSVDSVNFKFLSSRFTSLVSDLVKDKHRFSVKVIPNHPAPASVDLETMTINLDKAFFDGSHEIYRHFSYEKRLEFCAGVVVHEGAHIAFTPKNLFDLMLPFGSGFRNNYGFTVANVVEDIFIESFAKMTNPNFARLIDFVSDILFSEDVIESRRLLWNGEKPKNAEELSSALNYMICWKRRNFAFFHLTDFESSLYNLFLSANKEESVEARVKIVQDILTMILPDSEKIETEQISFASSCFSPDGEIIEGIKNLPCSEELPVNFCAFEEGKDSKDGLLKLKISPSSSSSSTLEVVSYSGFEKIVEARNAQRAIKGDPRNSGKKIRHLQHYSEGKIFGELFVDGGRVGRGKQEFVILVDLSGSMNGYIPNTRSKRKVRFALENVSGIAKALDREGFDYSIIGHTEGAVPPNLSYLSGKASCSVVFYRIKGVDEKIKYSNVHKALSWVNSNFIGCGNNDSCALLFASDEFSSRENEKILIVISDGQPVERNTKVLVKNGVPIGYNAVEDTKNVVQHLRRKGIKIFSLAIDEAAILPCEEIYGKNFSRSAFSPKEFVDAIIKFTE